MAFAAPQTSIHDTRLRALHEAVVDGTYDVDPRSVAAALLAHAGRARPVGRAGDPRDPSDHVLEPAQRSLRAREGHSGGACGDAADDREPQFRGRRGR